MLPSLKNTVRGLNVRTGKGAKHWRKAVVDRIFINRTKSVITKLKQKKACGVTPLLRAQTIIRALDGALADCGSGLVTFKGDPSSCRILTSHEQRYLVDRVRPCPFPVPDGIRQKRSCVLNKTTHATAFNLKLGDSASSHTCLGLVADEGPNDLPAYYWLPQAGYRAETLHDPLHRVPRDMAGAAKASGNWSMILDTTAVINYEHGPFLSCVNFAKQRESAAAFAAVAACDDEAILNSFEEMCRVSGDYPADFGSDEHVQRAIYRVPIGGIQAYGGEGEVDTAGQSPLGAP